MNNIYLHPEIEKALKNLLQKIRACNEVKTEILVTTKQGLNLHTRFQFFFNLKPDSEIESKLYELILSHAMKAEKIGPGSFDNMVNLLSENYEKIIANIPLSKFLENQEMASEIMPATISDVNECIVEKLKLTNFLAASLFLEAINLAGFGGKIIVEKTHAQVPSVELTCGYNFEVTPAWPLNVKLENPRIFVIDGFIENVSEIHHLLENQFEAKDTSLIFARGMSLDVISTLRANFERGTLKAIPIIVNFDLEGINTLNDIAIVSGCDVVSSNKGNLISSITYHDAPFVEMVAVYPKKIIIQNKKTAPSVASHVLHLKNKRNESTLVEDVGILFDKRIKSMSPNHVLIRIPENFDFVKTSQAIDIALRTLKSLIDYGLVLQGNKKVPAATNYATGTYLKKCVECIRHIGAMVI